MLSVILPITLSILFIAGGMALGRIMSRKRLPAITLPISAQTRTRQADENSAQMRAEAEKESARIKALTKQNLTEFLEKMAADLGEVGERLKRKEESIQTRESGLSERQQTIAGKEALAKERFATLQSISALKRQAVAEARLKMAQRAGVDEASLIQETVDERVADANLQAVALRLAIEERAKTESESTAKRIISIANERFNMSHQPEREHPGFRIYERAISEKIGSAGAFKEAFIAATQTEINVADDGAYVEVRCVDPLGREIGRRTLEYMNAQNALSEERIAATLSRVQREVDKEMERATDRAVQLLKIGPLKGEVKRLFARLLYRASYSQNQWHHAVEVAFINGMLAAEMGLDVKVARRAGLLHDIGKAMTHDHEGSHALLGADVARQEGESEEVANAIGAHHGEELNTSAYAEITAASDAISGARPGARREIQDAFSSKLADLEQIARAPAGVERVQIMHGGREVRIFVGEQEFDVNTTQFPKNGGHRGARTLVTDDELAPMARDIADQIEEKLVYPGQIRITLIRETRAVGVAR